jgi:hypothetical protein
MAVSKTTCQTCKFEPINDVQGDIQVGNENKDVFIGFYNDKQR